MRWKVVPRLLAQLRALTMPKAGEPEAVPWIMFSTKLYDSAATTELTFFDRAEGGSEFLTNMEAAGIFPSPKWFEVHFFGMDVALAPSTAAGGVAGAINDLHMLLKGSTQIIGNPIWKFTMSDKVLGPFPLASLHGMGGATGFGWGTFTAEESIQYANNGILGSGGAYPVGGTVIIQPTVGFDFKMKWPAAVTLAGGDANITAWMAGTLHRKVT